MKPHLRAHHLAYTILILGLGTFTLLFFHLWPDKRQQQLTVIGLAAFYFCWGVITHVKTKGITHKVVLEYAAVSILAAVLLLLVTF